MNTITSADFLSDDQGRRFSDVVQDAQLNWTKWADWWNDSARQDRLEVAEIHFDMPALAGVLKELESEPFVRDYFDNRTHKETLRVKQALGVLARMHMEARGWSTTGKKGPLGRRDSTRTSQGEHNKPSSFSKYIQSAERYQK